MERVEVKDVRVPEQLMRAMAAEAEAAREARAKVRTRQIFYRGSAYQYMCFNFTSIMPN